ncbi:MAG: DUF502 domain-containing protein [Lautropia sp.]|nr:DUF502 domain-containing protein [Lautropia sp.]
MKDRQTAVPPPKRTASGSSPAWRYILIGFFTVAPLWVTWWVFDFLFSLLARTGAPFLWGAARGVSPFSERVAGWLLDPSVQYVLAALATLAGLYVIGLLTSLVIGRRLIAFIERLLGRLPLVQTIYGATKRFLQMLQEPPVTGKRVVLISFPSEQMKTVGLITRVMTDIDTGRELAVVYVPTAPNPTSGYIEILPMDDLVMTDWTMEEAMSFVMTGGTTAPDRIRFGKGPAGGESRSVSA